MAGINYYHPDHLSNRVITNTAGTVIEQMGHLPYGENWYDTGSDKWKFTTYERDAESGNDDAMARYNVNRLGRFSSPDPLSGSTANPQSLNHYTYVGNDPINAMDPTGQSDMYLVCGAGPAMNYTDQTCAGESYALNGGKMTGSWGGGGGIDYGTDAQSRPYDDDPTSANSDEVDYKKLMGCVYEMYGVTMTAFTPAKAGMDGSLSGLGPDVREYNGFGYDAIHVSATVGSISSTNAQCNNLKAGTIGGCTSGTDWSQTYVPATSGGIVPQSVTTFIQLVEIGNSLAETTGVVTNDQASARDKASGFSDPPGADLARCVGYTVNGQHQ